MWMERGVCTRRRREGERRVFAIVPPRWRVGGSRRRTLFETIGFSCVGGMPRSCRTLSVIAFFSVRCIFSGGSVSKHVVPRATNRVICIARMTVHSAHVLISRHHPFQCTRQPLLLLEMCIATAFAAGMQWRRLAMQGMTLPSACTVR